MIGCLTATAERVGSDRTPFEGMTATFGLVCGTNISTPEGYQTLWASDNVLFTIDGGKLYIKKNQ